MPITIPDPLSEDDIRRVFREELAAAQTGPSGFLDVDGAADFLSTTPGAIRSMVKRGQIPFERTPNGRLLFTREELDAWVRDGGAS
jgi:excisionase family DNA binding protein